MNRFGKTSFALDFRIREVEAQNTGSPNPSPDDGVINGLQRKLVK
jgi:hypothetical protein